jgi:hypothetical protein
MKRQLNPNRYVLRLQDVWEQKLLVAVPAERNVEGVVEMLLDATTI